MTMGVRFKYYFAWLFADAIVNNAGLGFNGYDTDGSAKWDRCTNINVIHIEVSRNFFTHEQAKKNAKKIARFYRDLNSDRWIQSPEC